MTNTPNPENPDTNNGNGVSLTVGELSRRTGVTTATINYYVRIGVLPQPRKTSKTRALYPANFEGLILKIKELQAAGLNLNGIKQVINGDPMSPLAGAISSEQHTAMPSSSSPTGPIPIRDFLEQSGLDTDLYDSLIAADLLRRPRLGPDDTPAHDRRDLTAARAFARLKAAGINYQLLERHSEYSPLSRAEALFLAEHLNSATIRSTSTQPINLVAAFDTVRRYLRNLKLDEAFPDWRTPKN